METFSSDSFLLCANLDYDEGIYFTLHLRNSFETAKKEKKY